MVSSGSLRGAAWGSVLIGLMAAMSGCTATATVNGQPSGAVPTTCGPDTTVVGCVGSSTGYSCSGAASPDNGDPSLNCSQGTAGTSGDTLYCCIPDSVISTSCHSDPSISTCGGSSFGFSCTGGAQPDQGGSLVCSAGVGGNNGDTLYCCTSYVASSSTSTCTQDTTVQCGPSVIGFSCTGSDTPDQANASLACSSGTSTSAGSLFCCQTGAPGPGTTTPSCGLDGSVSCPSPSAGYTCTGGDTPTRTNAPLACGQGTAGASGAMSFCCNTVSTTTSVCNADPSVSCTAPSSGTTCTGSATPDPSLSCGTGTPNGNATSYCCNAATTPAGCAQDGTVDCSAVSGSDGYSCTGATSPETSTLLCGMPMSQSSGRTGYCCTTG